MKADIQRVGKVYSVDLSKPLDISTPLSPGNSVNAFYLPDVNIEPFKAGDFIGAVEKGGACNVNNVFLSPHGNGTHTECIGHITKEKYSINKILNQFFFIAQLITVNPEKTNNDLIITKKSLENNLDENIDALIIRTLPNDESKLNRNYSGKNPPYLHHLAAELVTQKNIKHLLLDVPSVDREEDGGKLLAHHAFWNYPANPRLDATITELIYADNMIIDGLYLLNIQIISLDNDASPSKPVMYKIL
ncbi:MAG: cyclase family protein [Bacteroidia bacterium]